MFFLLISPCKSSPHFCLHFCPSWIKKKKSAVFSNKSSFCTGPVCVPAAAGMLANFFLSFFLLLEAEGVGPRLHSHHPAVHRVCTAGSHTCAQSESWGHSLQNYLLTWQHQRFWGDIWEAWVQVWKSDCRVFFFFFVASGVHVENKSWAEMSQIWPVYLESL